MKLIRPVLLITALGISLAACTSTQHGTSASHACDPGLIDPSAVVAANADFEAALRASDTGALARLLTPDYLFVTASGEIRDRQELLRSYGAREVRLTSFESESIRVRLYGTVGILNADITKEGSYLSGSRAGTDFTGRYRFTRIYACGAEGWQLASTHESSLSE